MNLANRPSSLPIFCHLLPKENLVKIHCPNPEFWVIYKVLVCGALVSAAVVYSPSAPLGARLSLAAQN